MKWLPQFVADLHEIAEWMRMQRQIEEMEHESAFVAKLADLFNAGVEAPIKIHVKRNGWDEIFDQWKKYKQQVNRT